MKTINYIVLASLLLVGNVYAGDSVGNGGGGWACYEGTSTSKIKWVQLVDLYEAKNEFGLQLSDYKNEKWQNILTLALDRVKSANQVYYDALAPYVNTVLNNYEFVTGDLGVIEDGLYRVVPSAKECSKGKLQYVQIANYTHYNKVLIDEKLFNNSKLSEVDRAALILHEAIYSYARAFKGDSNSVRTRRIVGLVFSRMSIAQLRAELENMGELSILARGMTFSNIKAGTFMMGSPVTESNRRDGESLHKVTLTKDFEIQTTEVTVFQWVQIMKDLNAYLGYSVEDCPKDFIVYDFIPICPNLPITHVTIEEIGLFLNRLSSIDQTYDYRLPTEAEWEYAARGGTQTAYYFGDDPALLPLYENSLTTDDSLKNVASFKPNPFGLYDVHGNVAEMVADSWQNDLGFLPVVDPSYEADRYQEGYDKVFKGGVETKEMRAAHRYSMHMFIQHHSAMVGFRVVRVKK